MFRDSVLELSNHGFDSCLGISSKDIEIYFSNSLKSKSNYLFKTYLSSKQKPAQFRGLEMLLLNLKSIDRPWDLLENTYRFTLVIRIKLKYCYSSYDLLASQTKIGPVFL